MALVGQTVILLPEKMQALGPPLVVPPVPPSIWHVLIRDPSLP